MDYMKALTKDEIGYLSGIIEKVIDFVNVLHSQGFHLCVPIEYCLFADSSTKNKMQFYFFGHCQALYHKASKLKQQFKKMSQSEIAEVLEYYPVEEILNNKNNKAAFDKIDVWMLGKSFHRMFSRTNCCSYNDLPSDLHPFRQLVSAMTASFEKRMTMEEVKRWWDDLWQRLAPSKQ